MNKDRVFIPTSTCVRPICSTVPEQMCATGFQSKELIVNAQLLLGDVDQYPLIDVTIDGADECVQAPRSPHLSLCVNRPDIRVDHDLNCIKGGGGCHLREKVLAEAADTYVVHLPAREHHSANRVISNSFVLVADYRKNSDVLGTNVSCSRSRQRLSAEDTQWKQGIPIEVVPFAYTKILQNLHLIGSPKAVLRMAKSKAGPVVSDNGNFIIDAPFPENLMKEPYTVRMPSNLLIPAC